MNPRRGTRRWTGSACTWPSSARVAWLLALRRGADPELAAAAAAVHDYGRIVTGRQADHAEAGYLPVREFLRENKLFSDAEIETIALAVKNHSSKTVVGTAIEEIVKDADVIDCCQYGLPFDRPEKRGALRGVARGIRVGFTAPRPLVKELCPCRLHERRFKEIRTGYLQ